MAVKWHKTKYLGVRYREHKVRKHGVRFDRCFSIRYKLDGKDKEEVVGWSSDGITAEIAAQKLIDLRESSRNGSGARTLEEKRFLAKEKEIEEQKTKLALKERHKTLEEYWQNTYKAYAQSTKKASSFRAEEGHFRVWILPVLGKYSLIELGIKEWDELVTVLNKRNLSIRSKEYITGTLRRLLKHAKDRGLPVDIPSSKQIGIQTIKDNRRLRVLTSTEAKELLERLEETDISTFYLTKFSMLTGCRLSEAVNLKWAYVNFDEKFVSFIDTKNKDSRKSYMSEELRELLLSQKQGLASENVFLRRDGTSFKTRDDKSEPPYYFKEAVKFLKLNEGRDARDRVSFHTIRHTVATNLAKVLDVRSLMDVMGWKVISMAARYIHTHEETKRNAANLLADAWKE